MKLTFSKYQLLTFFGLFWIGLELLALLLALGGIFYISAIAVYILLAGLVFGYILFLNRSVISQNLQFLFMAFISLLFILTLSAYSTPTVFSGRDQGSFSEAAIRLSQNHQLTFSSPASQEFFKIYGPGQALNFPGFDYTKSGTLTTHFPLGYVAWLAVFYSLFGLSGLIIANGVTLFIFLLCFFLIARLYLKPSSALWAWLLAITSFSFMWFFKFTLSENIALAFLWFGIWEFLLFLKRESQLHLFVSLLSVFTLTFARIEAWAVLFMMLAVIFIKYRNWNIIKEKIGGKKIILPLIILAIIVFFNLAVNFSFYRIFAKGFTSAFFQPKSEADISSYSPTFIVYLIKVLGLYTLLNYLVLAFFGLIFFLKNKRYEILTTAFLSFPVLIYLINPSISGDHPWMLRRFVFVILPAAILYSVIFLEKFFTKNIFTQAILTLLLTMNLVVTVPYLKVAENNNLLLQTKELSQNFDDNDLILIDRDASGSGWSMISGPMSFLYGKQAVYFFNPNDLDKINRNNFSNIYFIIPDKNLPSYEKSGLMEKLAIKEEYRIETTALDIVSGNKNEIYSKPINFPREQVNTIYGKIYQLK